MMHCSQRIPAMHGGGIAKISDGHGPFYITRCHIVHLMVYKHFDDTYSGNTFFWDGQLGNVGQILVWHMGGDYRGDGGECIPRKILLGGTPTQASPPTTATFSKQKL